MGGERRSLQENRDNDNDKKDSTGQKWAPCVETRFRMYADVAGMGQPGAG